MWLRIKLFPDVAGLAALLLMFEQGGQPSFAKKIFSTLPNYIICMSHTYEIRVGYVSLISVLWTHEQGCRSLYFVWLEIFLSAALPQYTAITFLLEKFQYFLVPPAVREPTLFWALSLERSIKFWAENSHSHLRLFFQPERLSGICFSLLCNTCYWWQCRSFSASREERWLNRKTSFIKDIWIT